MPSASSSPERDAIKNKLQEIACRLQHAAVEAQRKESRDTSAADVIKQPLKISVAAPFVDDYQGFFVLNLTYQSSAVQLDPNFVLSCTGVNGATLKAQVWSSSTFQLLIPKYESETDDTASCGGGGIVGGWGWWGSSPSTSKTGRATGCRHENHGRSKEEFVLILIRLAFGLCILHGLGWFIKHGDADHYQPSSAAAAPGAPAAADRDSDDEMYYRICAVLINFAATLRSTVRKIVMNTL